VASAITKYFNTELGRIVVNNAMDIHAGRAVVVGPRNYMTNMYNSVPISITVEGANIMSRNLLIFGQGSMACHPFVRKEFYAVTKEDKAAFKILIWQHLNYFLRNVAKAVCSAWTGGRLIRTPHGKLRREHQRLSRLSYAFAWLSDFALMMLGGSLKRKERLSARLADGMSYLYMAIAALRLADQMSDSQEAELHAKWAVSFCFYHAQKAMIQFCHNFPSRILGFVMRVLSFPWGQSMRYPSDKLDHELARVMTRNNAFRDHLLQFVYTSGDPKQPLDRMEQTLQALLSTEDLYKKIGDLKRFNFEQLQEKLQEKVSKGELTAEEMSKLVAVEKLKWDAIQVDEFSFESLKKKTFASVTDRLKTPF
jgi:acyl-CoA dehydrogenase